MIYTFLLRIFAVNEVFSKYDCISLLETGGFKKNTMAGGRPLKFKTVEELQNKIDAYFQWCDSRTRPVLIKDKNGAYFIDEPWPRPYTVEGLASFLEVDRQTILNYEDREGFFGTIKKAKDKILANLTERSMDGQNNAAATIFNLKNNYGYEDKSSHELTGDKTKPVQIQILGNDEPITDEPAEDEDDISI